MIKLVPTLYKIFFIWLLFQFFAFNVATFSRGLDADWMQYVWLWKEWVIAALIAISLFLIFSQGKWSNIFPNKTITLMKLLLFIAIATTVYLNYAIHGESRWVYALAFKYDFFWFVILFVWFHSSAFLEQEKRKSLIHRYGKILKFCLLWALGRYLMVFIKPGILKLFGYNNFIFEWTAWGQAPAVYYTHINQWLPRNSFLFERPTTRWFFLTAFFPLFYYQFLHQKPMSQTWARWIIYGVNILITFSRAAWWAWVIELLFIWMLSKWLNKEGLKKFFLKILVPVVLGLGLVGFLWYKQIFARQYSNTGHIAMLKQGIDMIIEKPFTWRWPATAGPGSHRNPEVPGFNPENQFVQIIVEFGLIGFAPRFALFLFLNLIWVVPFLKDDRIYNNSDQDTALLAMSLGLIGLSASWMILHSFVDRMVVYPFMLLYWIVLTQYFANKKNKETASEISN